MKPAPSAHAVRVILDGATGTELERRAPRS